MKNYSIIASGLVIGLGISTAAFAGPDLKPKFGAKSGTVRVSNTGDAGAAGSWVTVSCAAGGGGVCPEPAPADVAPYLNPAFPNKVAIAVPALNAGQQHNHGIGFFDDLAFAPGTYSFSVCVDAGGDVAEDNEGNNCILVQKTVRSRFDGPGGLKSNAASN